MGEKMNSNFCYYKLSTNKNYLYFYNFLNERIEATIRTYKEEQEIEIIIFNCIRTQKQYRSIELVINYILSNIGTYERFIIDVMSNEITFIFKITKPELLLKLI